MTNHILCAVDLTHPDEAQALLSEAGRLATLEQATLSVMTVLPDYGSSFVGSFFKAGTLKQAAQAALDALHSLAAEQVPAVGKVQCIVEIGSVYEEVLEAAGKCGADLIVVGAHKPRLADRVMGPNAGRIVRHAQQSVLVVRLSDA